MPFIAPFVYGRASLYGPYPIRMPNHSHRAAGAASNAKPSRPLRPIDKLKRLGIPNDQARMLLNNIAEAGDRPYHAGKLWNGNVYLITQNDTVYYGKPAHPQKLDDVLASRTKCIDHQVRRFSTPDGLTIAVTNQRGRQWATAHTTVLCFTLPLPHSAQATFPKPKPKPQAEQPPSQ